METILFLSGFGLPSFISKSSWFFDESLWSEYHTIFYKSKTPNSDKMIENELDNLIKLTRSYSKVSVVGHSLGAWWAANLACYPRSKINKLAFWTPLGMVNEFPIFTASYKYEPFNKTPNPHNTGPNKAFVIHAVDDLIVPPYKHAIPLVNQFNAKSLQLSGGHAWQSDHKEGLLTLKNWLKNE